MTNPVCSIMALGIKAIGKLLMSKYHAEGYERSLPAVEATSDARTAPGTSLGGG